MKIAVLLKQVPDLVEELEVDDTGTALEETDLKLNEFDDYALEEALLLKEENAASTVTAIAVDGEGTDKVLYTAIAKGADSALKITGVDSVTSNLALANLFANAVRSAGYDLVITGVQSADDRDGQVAPMVAGILKQPCVEVVTGVKAVGKAVQLYKEYAGGVMAEFEVDLPAVLGIQAARQAPRYAPVSKVRQVQQTAKIGTVAGGDAPQAKGKIIGLTAPARGGGAKILKNVEELVKVLEERGVLA